MFIVRLMVTVRVDMITRMRDIVSIISVFVIAVGMKGLWVDSMICKILKERE